MNKHSKIYIQSENNEDFNLVDQLDEIRSRLIYILLSFILFTILSYSFKYDIFLLFIKPLSNIDLELIHTKPYDKFIAYVKISFYSGFLLSMPIILYNIFKFISPAFYFKEKLWTFFLMILALILFLLGSFLSYKYLIPISLKFLINFDKEYNSNKQNSNLNYNPSKQKILNNIPPSKENDIKNIILNRNILEINKNLKDINLKLDYLLKNYHNFSSQTIEKIYKKIISKYQSIFQNKQILKNKLIKSKITILSYLNWLILFMLIGGLSFELPILGAMLIKLEIINTIILKNLRPYMIVVFLIFSALITPPDILSQIFIAIPLYIFYEIIILISLFIKKKNNL